MDSALQKTAERSMMQAADELKVLVSEQARYEEGSINQDKDAAAQKDNEASDDVTDPGSQVADEGNATSNEPLVPIKVPVILDGSWQKRGFRSKNGLVSCISVDTGKVLDAEALTNYCHICARATARKPAPEHTCTSKFGADQSSGKMEPDGAKRIFLRSESTRGLIYAKYLGDGDSSSFLRVSEAKPYPNVAIEKLECVGHFQKRLGGRLRKLKKELKGKKVPFGIQADETTKGPASFVITDPDGNAILVDQHR